MNNSALHSAKPSKYGFISKLIATLSLCISLAVFIISALGIIICYDNNLYSVNSPDAKTSHDMLIMLERISETDLRHLAALSMESSVDNTESSYSFESAKINRKQLIEKYSRDNSNVMYTITDSKGETVESNYVDSIPKLAHLRTKQSITVSHFDDNGTIKQTNETFTIDAYITKLQARDNAFYMNMFNELIYSLRYWFIPIALLAIAISAAALIFLIITAGKQKGDSVSAPSAFDKIYLEIIVLFCALCFAAAVVILHDMISYVQYYQSYTLLIAACFATYFILFALIHTTLITVTVRLKTRTLIKSTAIYAIIAFIIKLIASCRRKIADFIKECAGDRTTYVKITILAIIFAFTDLFALILIMSDFLILGAFIWAAKNCFILYRCIKNAQSIRRLNLGCKIMLEGDIDKKICYAKISEDHKELAESINHISDGLSNALQKQMKSERLKTELITNVSHDIKTPLTSIINYVDLLQKEDLPESSREYLEILEKQSARLKKLTEDLIETSKAASGNIEVRAESGDLAILLCQSIGEYKDRFDEKKIELICRFPEEGLHARFDGNLCWRIFDNLLSNAHKYSLEGSRIYITSTVSEKDVTVTFKNISKTELNISPEELIERFVRGDSSRNTQGSGLGLSISSSLCQLQGGELKLEADGDLFKANVTIPRCAKI